MFWNPVFGGNYVLIWQCGILPCALVWLLSKDAHLQSNKNHVIENESAVHRKCEIWLKKMNSFVEDDEGRNILRTHGSSAWYAS